MQDKDEINKVAEMDRGRSYRLRSSPFEPFSKHLQHPNPLAQQNPNRFTTLIYHHFFSSGKLEGKILHRPQFTALLLDPSSGAGRAANQLLGRNLRERDLQRCQVALRFPELMLSLGRLKGRFFLREKLGENPALWLVIILF